MDMYDLALLFIKKRESIGRILTLDVSELYDLLNALDSIERESTSLKKTVQERLDVFEPPFLPSTTSIQNGTHVFYGHVYSVDATTPPMVLSTTYEDAAESAVHFAKVSNLFPYVNEYRVIRDFNVVLLEDGDDVKMLKYLAGGGDIETVTTFITSCFEGDVNGWMYKGQSQGLVVLDASYLSLTRTTYPTKEE